MFEVLHLQSSWIKVFKSLDSALIFFHMFCVLLGYVRVGMGVCALYVLIMHEYTESFTG